MFKNLYENGYKIVTDSSTASNDAFFFTPCLDTQVNRAKEYYSNKKKSKIYYYFINEGITDSLSVSFTPDSFLEVLPSLSLVLKNEESQGEEEKFIIRTPKHLATLKKFYDEINFYA